MWSLLPGVLLGKDGEVGGWGTFGLIRAARKPESCFLMDKTPSMALHQRKFSPATGNVSLGALKLEK